MEGGGKDMKNEAKGVKSVKKGRIEPSFLEGAKRENGAVKEKE